VASYSVSPALPAGLTLNTSTGEISGTPTTVSAAATFTVTALAPNTGGSTKVDLSISVSNNGSLSFVYSSNPAVYTKGTVIANNVPTFLGGVVTSYSVSPALPAGLNLNATTGVISGNPAVLAPKATYTITATTAGGGTNVGLSITVIDVGTFTATGSLNAARYSHASTLLPDGKVLVTGGDNSSGSARSSAEIYDPSATAGTFSTISAAMITSRYDHTATLLPDGRVLIAGGGNPGSVSLANAELFDPTATTTPFSATTGSMTTSRRYHTATVLPNGKVLMAGGMHLAGDAISSAELYDPTTKTFATTGNLGTGRTQHTATLLPNGKVLITGGSLSGSSYSAPIAELYDPATGTFTSTGSLITPRYGHTATLLPNGKVLIAGGNGYTVGTSISYLNSAELYDPATGTFSSTGNLVTGRTSHTASLLFNGKVLIAGGGNPGGYAAVSELYDPTTGIFSPTGRLAAVRARHTATVLASGKVLLLGGGGDVASAELVDTQESGATGRFTATGNLNQGRGGHSAMLLSNGKVLIAGGSYPGGNVTVGELFDPTSGTFTTVGSQLVTRSNPIAAKLATGNVLFVAGNADVLCEVFDVASGTFSATKGPLSVSRMYGTAGVGFANGKVLIVGGMHGSGDAIATVEQYDPATGTFSTINSLNAARRAHTCTLLLNGKVLIAGGVGAYSDPLVARAELYDPATGLFSYTGAMIVPRQGHTATLLSNGKVLITGGSGAGGRNLASAELYDPTTGTFSLTGDLIPTGSSTATPLPGGKALFTSSATNHLYDSVTGTFGPAAAMVTARGSHAATLLSNGKVLISGGVPPGTTTTALAAELFDPLATAADVVEGQ